MPYTMSDFMELLVSERDRCDAVHLHPDEPPVFEGKGVLFHLEDPRIGSKETEELLRNITSPERLREFQLEGRVCFEFRLREVAVFKVMAFREHDEVRLEIRSMRWL